MRQRGPGVAMEVTGVNASILYPIPGTDATSLHPLLHHRMTQNGVPSGKGLWFTHESLVWPLAEIKVYLGRGEAAAVASDGKERLTFVLTGICSGERELVLEMFSNGNSFG